MMNYRGALAALSVAASPIAAQQIRPYRPAFDALDYGLTIELPDSGASIRGTATIRVQRTGPSDSLVLDLLDLSVNRAAVNGKTARFWPVSGGVAIALP